MEVDYALASSRVALLMIDIWAITLRRLALKGAKTRRGSIRLLNALFLSVLFASSVGLGVVSGNPLVGSVSVFAFLMAVMGIVVADVLAPLLPSVPGAEVISR